ncbi:arsenate reductase ArsC [Streptomyces sp. NPDC057950]|uniref:arsenate reductase ArsC n=1 Tax=Streptomyces sp. NPDC057950 TaxID=3346288 RepID=UPI0036E36641
MADSRASVLFVCVHNAGRSQMAAAWLTHLSGGRVEVRSAGTLPAKDVNPQAVQAMREVGIDLTGQSPALLDIEAVQASDFVITMGCGDTCPIFPGKTYRDWDLPDPAGADLDTVRGIRDAIKGRVEDLIAEIDALHGLHVSRS